MLFGIRSKCLKNEGSQSLYLSLREAIKQNVIIIDICLFFLITYKLLSNILLLRLSPNTDKFIGSY
jgi:hypothetical protein